MHINVRKKMEVQSHPKYSQIKHSKRIIMLPQFSHSKIYTLPHKLFFDT